MSSMEHGRCSNSTRTSSLRTGTKIKATMSYAERYWQIPPEEALRENAGNFFLHNQDISSIKIKNKLQTTGRDDDIDKTITEMIIESQGKKQNYNIDSFSKNDLEILRQSYGDRVKA